MVIEDLISHIAASLLQLPKEIKLDTTNVNAGALIETPSSLAASIYLSADF